MSLTHPEFNALWHPALNSNLTTNDISAGSSKRVWWLCEKGHEWEASISNITGKKSGCPYCSGRKVLTGLNDLATTHPLIARKWHPTRNDDLTPHNVSAGSHKKVWWKCAESHEWQAAIYSQTNTSCPYCYGRYVIPGMNDLASAYPEAVKEWHPTKNGKLTPYNTMPYTPKKIWWLCKENHQWQLSPNTRFSKNAYIGCPYCSGNKLLQGFNDLATTHPDLAMQWHSTKNGNISPEQIMKSNETRYWWVCSNNHEWQAGVYSRAVMGTGCAVCSGKRVEIGVTDLLTMNPLLAAQWHPTKNFDLLPSQVAASSSHKAWWLCDKGHEWEAIIAGRHQGRNCARCTSGERASKAEKEVAAYVTSLGLKTELHSRKILKVKELDIYIPAKGIAIEFNGLYWHTEESGKPQSYHYDKWRDCKHLGIDLIQVWEDDWNRNPEAIKQFIAYKLSYNSADSVVAHKSVVTITSDKANSFAARNHPRGQVTSIHCLGLNNTNGSLIAVLAFNLDILTKSIEVTHFSAVEAHASCLETLLAYAGKKYNTEQYRVLDDHSYTESALWEECGFSAYDEIPADFTYLYKKRRTLKNDLSQEEIQGLKHIWDAGKTLYVK